MPRAWAPDLVPYGPIQAARIADAADRSSAPWLRAYLDPTLPLAALADAWLRDLPAPIAAWVVVRALLDSLGVALLYLAVSRVLNRGAALLAALSYAMSPAVWATARDPAGTLAGFAVAAGLLAAAWVVCRPTVARGFALGLMLALLVRLFPPGWGFVLAGALTLVLARASWLTGSVTALALLLGAGPALWTRPSAPAADLFGSAGQWMFMLGSSAWLPAGSVIVGSVMLANLIVPAAMLVLLLVLSGLDHALVGGWQASPRRLLLPIWGAGVLTAVVLFPATYPGESVVAVAMLPVLASVMALPIATSPRAPARWATGLAIVGLVAIGTSTIGLNLVAVERASHEPAGVSLTGPAAEVPAFGGSAVGSLVGLRATLTENRSLRVWRALADTVQDAADRSRAAEVAVLADDGHVVPMLASLLRGSPAIRRLPSGISVLPLGRETLFLILPETPLPAELTRPSSVLAVVLPTGEDTGARLATLRARPSIDWLARAEPVQDARFTDGSAVVGVVADRGQPGSLRLTLIWELPAAADGRSVGQMARVTIRGSGTPVQQDLSLPSVDARRGGELVVQQAPGPLTVPPGPELSVGVSLLDASGASIRTRDGAIEVTVLTRQAPR